MMNDIQSVEDIKIMVNSFYDKVKSDELLSPVFNNVVNFDWDEHLPIMYDFWKTLLIDKKAYQGQPYQKHAVLDIGSLHFNRWLLLFNKSIDANFQGYNADEAKRLAFQIASAFSHKMKIEKNTVRGNF